MKASRNPGMLFIAVIFLVAVYLAARGKLGEFWYTLTGSVTEMEASELVKAGKLGYPNPKTRAQIEANKKLHDEIERIYKEHTTFPNADITGAWKQYHDEFRINAPWLYDQRAGL